MLCVERESAQKSWHIHQKLIFAHLLINHLSIVASLNRLLERRTLRTRHAFHNVAIFENGERWHHIDAQLMRDVGGAVCVIFVEAGVWIFLDEL